MNDKINTDELAQYWILSVIDEYGSELKLQEYLSEQGGVNNIAASSSRIYSQYQSVDIKWLEEISGKMGIRFDSSRPEKTKNEIISELESISKYVEESVKKPGINGALANMLGEIVRAFDPDVMLSSLEGRAKNERDLKNNPYFVEYERRYQSIRSYYTKGKFERDFWMHYKRTRI